MAKIISKETMTVGIFAVLAGLAAAYGVRVYMTPEEAPPPPKAAAPALIKVPVASADLPADRVVAPGDMVQSSLTSQRIRERFKGLPFDQVMTNQRGILHRRLKKPIKQGRPFLTTDFYLEGTGPSITDKLQPGFRAIRVQVPDTREGGVQPGVYVDVLFRAKPRKAKEGQPAIPEMTVTLLRHIEVLEAERPPLKGTGAKGEPVVAPERKSVLVTLAVPEAKADIFGVVEGNGEVWLAPAPDKEAETKEAAEDAVAPLEKPLTLAGLLGIKPPPPKVIPPAPLPPPAPFETAIYRREKLHINQFVDGKLLVSHTRQSQAPRTQQKSKRSLPEALPASPEARTEEKEE